MAPLIVGLAGGSLATTVMTAVTMMLGDGGPPPTAALVAKFAGGNPATTPRPGRGTTCSTASSSGPGPRVTY